MDKAYSALDNRRIYCLITGLLASFLTGILFTWSVLQSPLVARLGGDALKSVIVLAYTLQSIFSTTGSALFGSFTRRLGERRTIILGALMLGLGYIAAGFVTSIPLFFLVFGFVAGTGDSFIYLSYMGFLTRLYPERRGLISGLIAGAFGGSAIVWAPLMARLIDIGGINAAFFVFGICVLVIILPSSFLVAPVPEGYTSYRLSLDDARVGEDNPPSCPDMPVHARDDAARHSNLSRPRAARPELTRAEAVRTGTFYLALLSLIFGLTSGNICMTQIASLMQASFGKAATAAAFYASLMSFMSMSGRFIWGGSADLADRMRIMGALTFIPVPAMFTLVFCHGLFVTVACMALTAFCFGGIGAVMLPIAVELFGERHASENFSLLYTAFGFAGLLGPQIAVRLSRGGDYSYVFLAAAIISSASFLLSLATAASHRRAS